MQKPQSQEPLRGLAARDDLVKKEMHLTHLIVGQWLQSLLECPQPSNT
jgi:hypothetical protein